MTSLHISDVFFVRAPRTSRDRNKSSTLRANLVSTSTAFLAMDLLSCNSTTGSFQNHPSVSSESQASIRPSRKRGIRALVADVSNQVDAPSCTTRACKESTSALLVTCTKKSRGDSRIVVVGCSSSDTSNCLWVDSGQYCTT